MKSIFNEADVAEMIGRINKLTPDTKGLWGKMTTAQMLAHCNVSYEMLYEPYRHPKPNAIMKFIIKTFIKEGVVGPKPYKRNSQTAPAFLIKDDKDFEIEKTRLIGYLNETQQLGEAHFDQKESHSFGPLTIPEWNTMFYKHLDHHLGQFGV